MLHPFKRMIILIFCLALHFCISVGSVMACPESIDINNRSHVDVYWESEEPGNLYLKKLVGKAKLVEDYAEHSALESIDPRSLSNPPRAVFKRLKDAVPGKRVRLITNIPLLCVHSSRKNGYGSKGKGGILLFEVSEAEADILMAQSLTKLKGKFRLSHPE